MRRGVVPAMTCPGPLQVKNVIVAVTVIPGIGCGAVWLRLGPAGGFRVDLCPDEIIASIDGNDHRHPRVLARQSLWGDVPVQHAMIVATGPYLDVTVNTTPVLRTGFTDRLLPVGALLLGAASDPSRPPVPAVGASPEVTFADLRVWQP